MTSVYLQDQLIPEVRCFGCGPANPDGLQLKTVQDGEYIVGEWSPKPHHESILGILSSGIIASLLDGYVESGAALDVLDGGCGTGLCAPVLAPYARRLTGVDLSTGMLAKARQCQLYGELVEAELTAYLQRRENAFDLIAMADTLIYFGDLAALFAAVRLALRPAGAFAFTVESTAQSGNQPAHCELGPSGRYRHSRRYLTQALAAAGLTLMRSDDVVLRSEFCRPTQGLGVLARVLP